MEWIFCESRLPEQRQLCVVACYEWSMFDDCFDNVIKYRILEYLPDYGIWNIKTPLRVLAWIPIPEFREQHDTPVPFPHPHKRKGYLYLTSELEEDADKEDTSVHRTESLAEILEKIQSVFEKAQSREGFHEEICQGGQQLQQGR